VAGASELAGAANLAGSVGAVGSSAGAGAGASAGVSGAPSGSGGGGGTGGSGTAGSAGSTSSGTAVPSAGCSKGTARPANGTVTVANNYYLAFPAKYDGKTPLPVILGFHGCGASNRGTSITSTEWMRQTTGTPFETDYVRAVPISSDSGGCWTYGADGTRVSQMFDTLLNDYCVDTSHVFGTGHSSGAQFLVQQLLVKKADYDHYKFKAIAPVAADPPSSLAGLMPVMYIDGKMDNQRSATSAADTVAKFRATNMCTSTSKPYSPVAACKSIDSGTPTVDPGCIAYDSCMVPTIWCSHNDPNYSNTQHGIPCFALKGMSDFFTSLH
jgi:poly(3-hydroxybutyrate) depolymerase